MTATYTFDAFSSLDGYGSYDHPGDWGGYWSKQGPELLAHRLASFDAEQRMVLVATTFRQFVQMLASSTEESEVHDPWVTRMRDMPATVVSSTLEGPLDWPDATVVSGEAVRSSGVRPTSTSNCSSTGRSTATSRSSSTGPPRTSTRSWRGSADWYGEFAHRLGSTTRMGPLPTGQCPWRWSGGSTTVMEEVARCSSAGFRWRAEQTVRTIGGGFPGVGRRDRRRVLGLSYGGSGVERSSSVAG